MSAEANRALVTQFYKHMENLEFGRMFELMADDGEWIVAGNPALFHHAGRATKPQRVAALANFANSFAWLRQDIRSLTAEDDRVCAEIITRSCTKSGIEYENELLILLHCRDDRIVRIYEHLDQATTLAFEQRLGTGDPAV